jgi:hypothetical protein
MHLDEGAVQALLHGELSGADSDRWTRHVAECAVCGPLLERARAEEAEVLSALEALDDPLPLLDPGDVRARASAAVAPRRTPWRVAASIVALLTAAGALYALPGSPLRAALERWRGQDASPVRASAAGDESGIALAPGDSFTVAFDAPHPGDSVRIVLAEDSLVAVRVEGAAAFAFRSGRLTVTSDAPVLYEVSIPRAAPLVRVEAAGRSLAEIRRGGWSLAGEPAEADTVQLPLSR